MHVYRRRSQLLFLESVSSTLGGYSSPNLTTCGASMVPTPPTSSPAPPLASFFLMLLSLGIPGACNLHRPFIVTNSISFWGLQVIQHLCLVDGPSSFCHQAPYSWISVIVMLTVIVLLRYLRGLPLPRPRHRSPTPPVYYTYIIFYPFISAIRLISNLLSMCSQLGGYHKHASILCKTVAPG